MARASALATFGLTVLAAVAAFIMLRGTGPDFSSPAHIITDPGLSQPADIVRFKGRYVASELYNNRLALFDDLTLDNLEHFDPDTIGRQFRSPHFLAVTPGDTLLISNGWGDSIVEISDLDGSGWREFSGIGETFHAPHGICIDDDGWIYVGDSLNSRLVRFRDMAGTGWQVFEDVAKRISYIRELVCRDGAVWASNSYENRPGLNPGEGSNVLKITDFASGEVDVVASFPDVNATSLLLMDEDTLVLGLWGLRQRLVRMDAQGQSRQIFPRLWLGTPYGTWHDPETRRVLVTYIGRLSGDEQQRIGGIAVYR